MSSPDPKVIAAIQERTMPFVNDPTYAPTLYGAMGRMILLWGRLEKSLDDLLIAGIIISKNSSGESHNMYVSLARKLTLLVQIFHKSKQLKPLHARAVSLVNDIRKNSGDRNLIIHAGWRGFEEGNTEKIKMQHLKHENDQVVISDFTVSITNLSDMCSNFHLCNAKIIALLLDIQEILKESQARARARAGRRPPTC